MHSTELLGRRYGERRHTIVPGGPGLEARHRRTALREWATQRPFESLVGIGLTLALLLHNLQVTSFPGLAGLGIAGLALVYVVRRHRRGLSHAQPSPASVFFLSLILLSVFWSDVPPYSGERLRTFGPTLVAAWLMGSGLTRDEFRISMQWLARIALAWPVFFLIRFPWARDAGPEDPPGWHAQYSKNGLGLLLVFCLVLSLVFEHGLIRVVEVATIAVVSIGNQSRTSQLIMLLIAILLIGRHWLSRAHGWHRERVRARVLSVGLAAAFVLVLLVRDAALSAVGKDPTLSQRTRIWEASLPQILEAPWLGHGVYAFLEPASDSPSKYAVAEYFHLFVPPNPHNGMLDLLGQLGIVGLLAYAVAITSLGIAIARAERGQTRLFGALTLVFLLLSQTVEATSLGGWLVVTAFLDGQFRALPATGRENDITARKNEVDLVHVL